MTAIAVEKKSKKMKRSAEEAAATEEVPVVEKKTKKSKKEKKSKTAEEEEPTAAPSEEEPKKEKKSKKSKKADVTEEAEPKTEEVKTEEPAEEQKVEEKKEDNASATAADDDNKTVIIFGLPYAATEEVVKKDFEECGEIVSFRMPLDRETQQPKGMAFCEYATTEGVKKALEYNETDYNGRTLRVRMCEPDSSKGGKGGKDGKGKGKGKGGKGGKGPGEKPDGCLSVVVKFLSQDTTESKLWELFEGESPSKVKLLTDRDSGESKCIAFVDFEDTSKVDEAVKKNGQELDGKNISVGFNVPREKGEGKGKDGKDGKGKGKGKGKKGKGKMTAFEGKATTFDDSDDE